MSVPAEPVAAPTGHTARLQLLAAGALLGMGAAWGSTFFLLKDLLTRIGVADLLAVRFAVATLVLVALGYRRLRMTRRTLVRGIGLGVLYGLAQLLQTTGITLTSASNSGFVTGLYVVVTPLLGALLFRIRVGGLTWLAVALATGGLGVLSLTGLGSGGLAVDPGELLVLGSAVLYAGHIIAMSRWSSARTAISLSIVQMVVITIICTLGALPGGIAVPHGTGDWLRLLYLAVVAGALALVLQTWAQAIVEPTRAAVIMASEPVWAAAFAVALGGERVTWRMLVGGAGIVAAMYLVELAPRLRRRRGRALADAP